MCIRDRVRLNALISNPVAWIEGGSRSIGSNQGILLDGSLSHDPDQSEGNRNSELSYSWSCSSNISKGCTFLNEYLISLPSSAIVSLPSGTIKPKQVLSFTLKVTNQKDN
eukprot:TRINITY_DN19498_c0_g1_i1.p1 TRINITY_DN19498_c0_g1~~TRINITY_DN19498_c0_g1_i1.p1  ORF type:complete len:110 (-),score=7.85 TRINITY_DN19498_c0_g1_i1:273-602(-)